MKKLITSSLTDSLLNVALPTLTTAAAGAMMAATMTNMESAVAGAAMVGSQAMKARGQQQAAGPATAAASAQSDPATRSIADYVQIVYMNVVSKNLQHCFDARGKVDLMKLKDETALQEADRYVREKTAAVARLREEQKSDFYYSDKVSALFRDILRLIEGLHEVASASDADSIPDGLYRDFGSVQERCFEFGEAKVAAMDGVPQNSMPSPSMMDLAKKTLTSTQSSVAETYTKRMFMNCELRKEQLRSTEAKAEELRKQNRAKREEMEDVLKQIMDFESAKATKGEEMVMIAKGLSALYDFRNQFAQLALFFKQIDNLLQTTTGPMVEQFSVLSRASLQCSDRDREAISAVMRDKLYKLTSSATVTTRVVEFLAGSYFELSKDHLMPLIRDFGPSVSLTADSDPRAVEEAKSNLMKRASAAQAAITKIVDRGHEQFREDVQKRIQQVEAAYEDKLPALPAEERKRIAEDAKEKYRRAAKGDDDLDDFCL